MAPTSELYDLKADPAEVRNLRLERASEAAELERHVWEIAGPRKQLGKLERRPVDDKTMRELQSLGYASAGTRRDLRLDMSGPDPKERVQVLRLLDQASDFMNQDRFAAAIPLLEKALQSDTTNPAIYGHLGICYQSLQQFPKAVQLYQMAIQNKSGHRPGSCGTGRSLCAPRQPARSGPFNGKGSGDESNKSAESD